MGNSGPFKAFKGCVPKSKKAKFFKAPFSTGKQNASIYADENVDLSTEDDADGEDVTTVMSDASTNSITSPKRETTIVIPQISIETVASPVRNSLSVPEVIISGPSSNSPRNNSSPKLQTNESTSPQTLNTEEKANTPSRKSRQSEKQVNWDELEIEQQQQQQKESAENSKRKSKHSRQQSGAFNYEFDDALLQSTSFHSLEYKLLKLQFRKLCSKHPDKLRLSKDELKEITVKQLYQALHFANHTEEFISMNDQQISRKQLEEHVYFFVDCFFNAFKTSNSVTPDFSFSRFIAVANTLLRGKFDEKSKFSFIVYDLKNTGLIERSVLQYYIKCSIFMKQILDFIRTSTAPSSVNTSKFISVPPSAAASQVSTPAPVDESDILFASKHTNLVTEEITIETVDTLPSSSSQLEPPKMTHSSSASKLEEDFHAHSETQNTTANHLDQEIAWPHTIEQWDTILNQVFQNQSSITYEAYEAACEQHPALLSTLVLPELFVRPLYDPIATFLQSKNPFSAKGQVKRKNRIYECEINGGIFRLRRIAKEKAPAISSPSTTTNNNTETESDMIHPSIAIQLSRCKGVEEKENQPQSFYLVFSNNSKQCYTAPSVQEKERFVFCILLFILQSTENRYNSFAPVRHKCKAKYFIDGKDYFAAVAKSIKKANETIYISGWGIYPSLYLVRDSSTSTEYRLDLLLQMKAAQGVKIYILLWDEAKLAGYGLETTKNRLYLESLHENITCIAHSEGPMSEYSHHQKMVIVDEHVAYLGGFDLLWARFDDTNHNVVDECHFRTMFPGRDFYNNNHSLLAKQLKNLDEDLRMYYWRMPWHDVAVRVADEAARDVATIFIRRWNHNIQASSTSRNVKPTLTMKSQGNYLNFKSFKKKKKYTMADSLDFKKEYNADVQVLRSAGLWSSGEQVEQSIYTAYIDLIGKSQHYIYIENQYFISSTAGATSYIQNEIASAIVDRIRYAIHHKQTFRVIVVLPLHTDGNVSESSTKQVMKYQYKTIDRSKSSVYAQLRSEFPNVALDQYISFYCLRNYGFLGPHQIPVSEQIYVHDKIMIVDDKCCIIGSANINDRSLFGSRDSEIAVLIEDVDFVPSLMNGKLYRAGRFCKHLRLKLMAEHLGLLDSQTLHQSDNLLEDFDVNMERSQTPQTAVDIIRTATLGKLNANTTKLLDKTKDQLNLVNKQALIQLVLADPISNLTYTNLWMKTAIKNTEIYEKVFEIGFPSSKYTTIAQYKKDKEAEYLQIRSRFHSGATMQSREKEAEKKKLLEKIKGHLIVFPFEFLKNETFKKDIPLTVLDKSIFQ